MEFKTGDKVLCIKSGVSQFKVGEIYKVIENGKKVETHNCEAHNSYFFSTLGTLVDFILLSPAMEIMYGEKRHGL